MISPSPATSGPSVISTVLAYLETDGILEATGSFYGTYRAKLLNTREKILAGRSRLPSANSSGPFSIPAR